MYSIPSLVGIIKEMFLSLNLFYALEYVTSYLVTLLKKIYNVRNHFYLKYYLKFQYYG